jgi:hypothetical protein
MLAAANQIGFTEYEIGMGDQLTRELGDHDFYVVATRDPLSRSVSSFNFDHPIGGGSRDVASVVDEWKIEGLPPGCTSECKFCVEEDTFDMNPAYHFTYRPGKGMMAPWRVPNMTEAPLVTPCLYDTYEGFVPTSAKPLMASMYMDCFYQMPGGVNAWAEALDGEGVCADLARRHLHETAESLHQNNGYDAIIRGSGLLDKLRKEAPSKEGKHTGLIVVRFALRVKHNRRSPRCGCMAASGR